MGKRTIEKMREWEVAAKLTDAASMVRSRPSQASRYFGRWWVGG